MIEVTKEQNHIKVSVKFTKRIKATDPKVYFYTHDAYMEAVRQYPDLNINKNAVKSNVASNVRAPHETTWLFPFKEEQQESILTDAETSKTPQEQGEKKELKSQTRRAKLERLSKQKQISSSEE